MSENNQEDFIHELRILVANEGSPQFPPWEEGWGG